MSFFVWRKVLEYIVEKENKNIGSRLDKFIDSMYEDITRSYAQKLIEMGSVTVNGKTEKASYRIKCDDIICIEEVEPENIKIEPENIPLDIVYEDKDIIIVNKPKQMVVHPGNGSYSGTLVNALMYSHGSLLSGINGVVRPGIVHRIDKDTTGILVVAKTDKAHKILSEIFKKHDIKRRYLAIVRGIVKKDNIKIDLPIGRDPKDRKQMAVARNNSRNAITHIKVLERFIKSDYTLVEATLETGRTHQIRVHMSYIGHPLLGDTTYSNGKNEFGVVGQLLHAETLGFSHPITGEYMEFNQKLPKEFEEVLMKLRSKEN